VKILLGLTELNQKFGPGGFQHGLAIISAVLKLAGFTDVCLAEFTTADDLRRWKEDLARLKPDVIGFYSVAEQFHIVRDLIECVPPGIFTIVGGPHPTCYPECIEKVPRLDAICIGEGEYPMLELVQALESGRDFSAIPNLWVRRDGKIIRNPTRPFMENLDDLPFADLALFNPRKKINRFGLSQISMMTSRGCPFRCAYCANKRLRETQPGRYVRWRSMSHVMGELKDLKSKYLFEEVVFDDDLFMTMDEAHLSEFCERYPREIGKPFIFCGHVALCSLGMLTRLKAAGARRIDMGVESGNEGFRRNLLKREMTNQQIINATRLAKKVGLEVKTFNMVGMPDETPAMHMDTVMLNREINPDVATIFTFSPYPGTELYDYSVKKGYYMPSDRPPKGFVSRRGTVMNMPFFPKGEIERCARLFGFRVFRKHSLGKAIGYAALYSKHGESFLKMSKSFLSGLRIILGGF